MSDFAQQRKKKSPPQPCIITNIRFPVETWRDLEAVAEALGFNKNSAVVEAVKCGLAVMKREEATT